MIPCEIHLWTDGSYDKDTNKVGGGIVIRAYDESGELLAADEGMVSAPDKPGMWNVYGELLAVMRGIDLVYKLKTQLNITNVKIYYDYTGIEAWAKGEWRTKKDATKEYATRIQEAQRQIPITFVKVKSHSKIAENDRADSLARQACGLEQLEAKFT
jgi:ribonuclease HI